MNLPDYIKPGAFVTVRSSVGPPEKGRIYAIDAGPPAIPCIHGAIWCGSTAGWRMAAWYANGLSGTGNNSYKIVGPWVEPGTTTPDVPPGFWDKLPAWMDWVIQGPNGNWMVYNSEPILDIHAHVPWGFINYTGVESLRIPPTFAPRFTGKWQDSKIQRPPK